MYLAIDVGGTFIKYARVGNEYKIESVNKIPTTKNSLSAFLKIIEDIYNANKDVKGIGISCPGQIDSDTGFIHFGGALTYLNGCNIVDELKHRGIGIDIAIENDANCAAIAESFLGNAKEYSDAVFLVFGTGIGCTITRNKKILKGKHLLAGEIGLLSTNYRRKDFYRQEWEENNSALSLPRQLEKRKGVAIGAFTGEDVFAMALKKDYEANDILEEFFFQIANQIYNLQYIVDPELFCIGGGISAQEMVIDGINRNIDLIFDNSYQFMKPLVKVCKFQNEANLIGAIVHLQNAFI